MSIRRKFFKYILPPSVFGILLTTILAIYFLLIFYFNLLKNTKENVLSEEYTSMKSISDSLAMSMQEYFISKASYLEECINFSESLMITSKPSNFGIQNITALNAYDISVGEHDDEFVNLPYEINKKYSMWYLNTITDVSLLSEKSLERLLFASQLELEMKSIYEGSEGISAIFVLFMDDGLQFEYPSFKTDRYSNYSLKNDECPVSLKIENYDLRCSRQIQFGLNFLKNISVNTTQFLSEPFMIMEHKKFGITLCCIHYKNTTSSNFSNIPKSERVIDYLICAEFSFIDMENVNKAFIEHNGYHYVLDKFNHLIFHPKLRKNYNFTVHEYVQSITHYEFDMPDNFLDPLALEYNKTILPLIQATFTQNEDITSYENQIIKLVYNKKDGEYFGTISPLFFPITGSSDYYHLANLVFIEKSDVVVQPFDNIENSIYRVITIQSIVVFILIIILSWIGFRLIDYIVNSIITPLTDLSEVIRKMLDDDLDTDVTRNYIPNSEEMTQLYQSFSKLKFVMKYANAEFFCGNDAQALMNYSNALKLYEEINNNDGIGMIYNNIGNIHLKNKRFEEAIFYYRKAVHMIENDLNAFYKDNSFFREPLAFKNQIGDKKPPLYIKSRSNYKTHKMVENEVLDDSTLKKMNELYSNRLFQLGLTLYTQVFTNNHEENLEDVIDIFEKVIKIDSFLQTNPARTIQALIFISNCHLELDNNIASLKYLNEAESSVFLYETAQNMLQLDPEMVKKLKEKNDKEINTDLDFFSLNSTQFTIKSDILKQLWMYHSAAFCKKMGKFKQACIIYTKTLETGMIYDPLIRKKCLEDLSFILASQGLLSKAPNVTTILNRLDTFKGKEILFLLDVSESMGQGARLKYGIRNFLKIFDKYVRPDDIVCFIRFNYMVDVVFNFTPKKNNTIQLRRQIESTCKTHGGTAFFDAINAAIKEFDHNRRNLIDDSSNVNSYWIVSLTDGDDNFSKISAETVKKKLKKRGINLIIVGLGLGFETVGILSELCKATKDGVFIETPNNNDLDIAFEAISEIIYGPNFIVETFAFS